MDADTPLFDVIVPTYNNWAELAACLEGFEQQTLRSFRLLVCVDGATDGTVEHLTERQQAWQARGTEPALVILQQPDGRNHGRNAARNLALPSLRAPFLAMLDADIVPDRYWLEAHWQFLQGYAAEGGCISLGAIEYTNTRANAWARYTATRGKAKYEHGAPVPFHYFTTGNAALPAACFTELGGMDPAMTSWGGGDAELGWRLHQAYDLPVFYNEHAAGRGAMNKSLAQAIAQMRYMGAHNLRYIHRKHPAFTQYYRLDLLTGTDLRSRAVQALLNPVFEYLAWFLLVLASGPLERQLIHFLALRNLYRGFCEGPEHTPAPGPQQNPPAQDSPFVQS